MSIEELKRATGYRAAEYVSSGMVVGLGSGSTAKYATLRIGELLARGDLQDIVGIPTSNQTEDIARAAGIPLTTLNDHPHVDVTIDGADEVDPQLDMIKGHGGFLLREKIVAASTAREIIVVDDGKLVNRLGEHFSVPVEVVHFAKRPVWAALEATGCTITRRMEGNTPWVTDEGNCILDCDFGPIDDPRALDARLRTIPGVVETGLFLDMADVIVIASADGVRVIER